MSDNNEAAEYTDKLTRAGKRIEELERVNALNHLSIRGVYAYGYRKPLITNCGFCVFPSLH